MPHRPAQEDAIRTRELALNKNVSFHQWNGTSDLGQSSYFLITGAGIIDPQFSGGKPIINAHPGIIPAARGLDAFKWAIYDGVELGVTLHLIDREVDKGEIIAIERTPIYPGDSLATLARRHYELEVSMLAEFDFYLQNRAAFSLPERPARMRMPITVEAEMVRKFDAYKERFASRL